MIFNKRNPSLHLKEKEKNYMVKGTKLNTVGVWFEDFKNSHGHNTLNGII